VDFNLKNDYEFVKNYKELQKGFTACKIEKVGAAYQHVLAQVPLLLLPSP
jgi:hypothetical protein